MQPVSSAVTVQTLRGRADRYELKVKVKVTLRLTVSQSVLVSSPNLGLLTRGFFFFQNYRLVLFGAPSLTRSRVCHVSVFVIEVYSSQSLFTTIYTGLVQSRLCTADYALLSLPRQS
jgi:hypothetical protein